MKEGVTPRAEIVRKCLREEYLDSALKIRRAEISNEGNATNEGQMSEWTGVRLLPGATNAVSFTFVICWPKETFKYLYQSLMLYLKHVLQRLVFPNPD